jgi:hypothetical protein
VFSPRSLAEKMFGFLKLKMLLVYAKTGSNIGLKEKLPIVCLKSPKILIMALAPVCAGID